MRKELREDRRGQIATGHIEGIREEVRKTQIPRPFYPSRRVVTRGTRS